MKKLFRSQSFWFHLSLILSGVIAFVVWMLFSRDLMHFFYLWPRTARMDLFEKYGSTCFAICVLVVVIRLTWFLLQQVYFFLTSKDLNDGKHA